jgi:hypothetical protein
MSEQRLALACRGLLHIALSDLQFTMLKEWAGVTEAQTVLSKLQDADQRATAAVTVTA